MDKEVSYSVHLAVTLISLAILITLVMYTVYVGTDLKGMFVDKAVSVQENLSTGQLDSIAGGDTKIMPKASAYYILSNEYVGIITLDYSYVDSTGHTIGGLYKVNPKGMWTVGGSATDPRKFIFPSDIIDETSLDGKVSIDVVRAGRGQYNITIKDIDLHE